jgi:hypothetical protein
VHPTEHVGIAPTNFGKTRFLSRDDRWEINRLPAVNQFFTIQIAH